MRVHETEVDPVYHGTAGADSPGVTCSQDWRKELKETVSDGRRQVHLVGVGNELKSDDAVGLQIASSLRSRLGASPVPGVEIHPCTPMPERLLSKLASGDGRIIVFDAVEASVKPGEVVFRSMADTQYGFFGTHNIPLRLVPGLKDRMGDFFLVGIQPASLDVGLGLSKTVQGSVSEIVAVVAEGVAERT